MRRVYSVVLYLLIPGVIVYLLWRGLRNPAYWRRWRERFGWVNALNEAQAPTLWIHAVSVGEVQAAVPLVRALRIRFPQQKILLTTTTPTGSQCVTANFGRDIIHCYIPYDLPGAVQRFLARTRPCLAVMMETELWPNIFYYCETLNIPIIVANARMSERSAHRYLQVSSLTSETLAKISTIAAQTAQDARRLVTMGALADRMHITGTIKFDIKLPASLREEAEVLRRSWGVARAVWIAASTHEGEERYILDAFALVKHSVPHCLLVLVPRHLERFTKVAGLCQKRGYTSVLRSEQRPCNAHTDVFIGDSMGELNLFYAASDVAFVGGSLVPTGGHNLLEPAALGLPVITGPFTYNFEEITRMLCAAGAALQVHNAEQLSKVIVSCLNDANLRYTMGEKGRRLIEQNRGALDGLIEMISRYIK